MNITTECERRINIRLDTAERRERSRLEAEIKRGKREQEAELRKIEADSRRNQVTEARRIAVRERRDLAIQLTSKRLGKLIGLPVTSAALLVTDVIKQLRAGTDRTIDESIRSVVLASEDKRVIDVDSFISMAAQYVQAELTGEVVTAGNGDGVTT